MDGLLMGIKGRPEQRQWRGAHPGRRSLRRRLEARAGKSRGGSSSTERRSAPRGSAPRAVDEEVTRLEGFGLPSRKTWAFGPPTDAFAPNTTADTRFRAGFRQQVSKASGTVPVVCKVVCFPVGSVMCSVHCGYRQGGGGGGFGRGGHRLTCLRERVIQHATFTAATSSGGFARGSRSWTRADFRPTGFLVASGGVQVNGPRQIDRQARASGAPDEQDDPFVVCEDPRGGRRRLGFLREDLCKRAAPGQGHDVSAGGFRGDPRPDQAMGYQLAQFLREPGDEEPVPWP